MSVKITDNHPKIALDMSRAVNLALRYALDDVDRIAFPKTPKDRGELRKNLSKQVVGGRGTIVWKSGYAVYQERGYSSGKIRRYTTPGTGAHFAFNAVKQVDANKESYLRKARAL